MHGIAFEIFGSVKRDFLAGQALQLPADEFRHQDLILERFNLKADLLLKEGTEIRLGNTALTTMHTPGHTPGSAVFYVANEGVLFSGDTVMAGASGRTDLRDGSPGKMTLSLRRLYRELPGDTKILPGHGPATTLRNESWIADIEYPLLR